jgi:hypothetical protein
MERIRGRTGSGRSGGRRVSFGNLGDQQILIKTIEKATITWTTADGTSRTVPAESISRGGIPIDPGTKSPAYLPPPADSFHGHRHGQGSLATRVKKLMNR